MPKKNSEEKKAMVVSSCRLLVLIRWNHFLGDGRFLWCLGVGAKLETRKKGHKKPKMMMTDEERRVKIY